MSNASKQLEKIALVDSGDATPAPETDHQLTRQQQNRSTTWTGFEMADWDKAQLQRRAESNLFYKGDQVSPFVELGFFKTYGSGVYLFFSFVWHVSLFFLFMTVVSIAPITLNHMKGNAFSNSQMNLQFFVTRASIGNYQYIGTSDQAYSDSITYKIVNASIDIFLCFTFLVFTFYWEKKSNKIVEEINQEVKLLSACTVEVVDFPRHAKEQDIDKFMSRFADVLEVAAVKNYSDQIQFSKDIYDYEMEIKELEQIAKLEKSDKVADNIMKLKAESKLAEDKIENMEVSNVNETLKFYVQFETPEKRNQVLKTFLPHQKSVRCCQPAPPAELLLDEYQVWIRECNTEPMGIIWENVHVTWRTRWARMLLQFVIIVAIIACAFILISFLNVLLPPSNNNIDTSAYTWESIQLASESKVVEAWCNKNISFPNSPYQEFCWSYWIVYIKGIAITVGISVVIVVFKFVVKTIMVGIAKFQRYGSHTEQSVSIMTNLLITYISTTVLITFLMQANVFSISFKSIIRNFITDANLLNNLSLIAEYYDLTSTWYRDIGYQIWFNVFLLGFIPHFYMPLLLHLSECLSGLLATREKFHKKMYECIRPAEFEIEDHYANVLLIITIGFVFGGGSPCMIVASFIGLISRYVYFKYVFIRFSRIPRTYNQSLNDRAINVLKIVLIVRCLISLYMYGASDIFAMEKSTFMKWTDNLTVPFFSSIFVVISRILLTWYYSIFTILFILIIVCKDFLVEHLISLCRKSDLDQLSKEDTASDINKMEIVSQRALTKSYKLEKNPDYMEILAIMRMRHRKKSHPQRVSVVPEPIV